MPRVPLDGAREVRFAVAPEEPADPAEEIVGVGELGVALVLETHFPREDLTAVSEGWGGDLFAVFEKEGAPPMVVWLTEWDGEEDAIEFQAQAFRLMKRVLPPDSELAAPAMRKKTGVVFGVNVPKELQSDLLDAVWKCKRTPGRTY